MIFFLINITVLKSTLIFKIKSINETTESVSRIPAVENSLLKLRILQGLRFSSVNELPEPSPLSSSYSSSVNKSLSKLPTDLSTDFSKKSFRQMKLSNTFLR